MKFSATFVVIFSFIFIIRREGHCAPRIFVSATAENHVGDSDETNDNWPASKGHLTPSLRTIEAGLELVQLLPSDIHHRKITDAVVVLGQALQNQNPILQSAIERAISHMTDHVADTENDDDITTSSFLSFLRNLKDEMSIPHRFPQQFSQWMKNQILVVETTLLQNLSKINKLIQTGSYGNDLRSFAEHLAEKIVNFNLFIQNGLEKLESASELQFNLEIGVLRESFATGKYYQVTAAVVWDIITQDEPEPIDFLHALRGVYKRASPDLQPIPQTVLRTVEIFLKTLPKGENDHFLEQLGTWNPSTALTSIPEGL